MPHEHTFANIVPDGSFSITFRIEKVGQNPSSQIIEIERMLGNGVLQGDFVPNDTVTPSPGPSPTPDPDAAMTTSCFGGAILSVNIDEIFINQKIQQFTLYMPLHKRKKRILKKH